MKNSDVELVHRILDGDDRAFSELVKKYQKPVHALVWRKIGDFPYRRGDYTGYVPKSVPETPHIEETAAFYELALRHRREQL